MPLTRLRATNILDSDYKNSCRVTTTTNITLSGGAPTTVDSITLVAGNRVLVQGQSAGAENGIYRVSILGTGVNGTWVRDTDATATGSLTSGTMTFIEEGTTNGNKFFYLATTGNITIGTTALTFTNLSATAGGANPGGSNSMVQFNDVGAFGGATFFQYNKSSGNLVSNSTSSSTSATTGALVVGGGVGIGGAINVTGNAAVGNIVTSGTGGQHIGYLTGAIGANVANTGVFTSVTTTSAGQITGYHTGAIGANTANTGVFTSVTTVSGGQLTGYVTGPIGANTANTGVFTSVTTTSAGQITGYHTGAIGANTANTGAFTTITSTGNVGFGSVFANASAGSQFIGYLTGAIGANVANTGAFTTLSFTTGLTSSTAGANVTIGGSAGAVGTLQLMSGWGSPSNNRIAFGTDGTGWQLRFGKNQAGTYTDYIALNDSGTLLPLANNSYNLGTTTANWATVYAVTFSGTSTTAKYADLAENYLADKEMQPGQVVVFGGTKEITVTDQDHNSSVAGVISTNPAYLMNSGLENSYPVALTGRVPCLVKGPVNKGDVLVTASIAGVAQRIDNTKFVPGVVLGKSLESIATDDVMMIEVVVGRF